MKKVLFALLASVLCSSLLVAHEEEAEDSMFTPSISIENELSLPFKKKGKEEEKSKGNVELTKEEIENETVAEFGVGIAIGENFSLTPYIKDTVGFGAAGFKSNEFMLGFGIEFAPMEILTLSTGLAYVNALGEIETNFEDGDGEKVVLPTNAANGFQFGIGVAANIESMFLELEAGYEVKGMFAKPRIDEGDKAFYNASKWENTITLLNAKMDFFNFIKEGLNSGLFLSNELTINVDNTTTPADPKYYGAIREIGYEFAAGLHFAPLEFMDAKVGVSVESVSKAVWDMDNKGYKTNGGELAVSLPVGLEFSKGMFTFGLEYTPTLMKKEHVYDDDYKFKESKKVDDLEQKLKLAASIKL